MTHKFVFLTLFLSILSLTIQVRAQVCSYLSWVDFNNAGTYLDIVITYNCKHYLQN